MTSPPFLPSLTLLCRDLQPSPATTEALEFGHWLQRSGLVGAIETVAQWGGTQHASFAAIGPVHLVHHDAWEPPWDPSLQDRVRPPAPGVAEVADAAAGPDAVPRPPGRQPASVATSLLRGARLGRLAAGIEAQRLRRVLGASPGPVWLAGPAAGRLLHYLPAGRPVIANQPDADPRWDELDESPDRALLQHRPRQWVVSSPAARAQLEQVGVAGAIVDCPDVLYLDDGPEHRDETRAVLDRLVGARPGTRLVGTMGDIDWWDEPDLFVQLAWEIHRRPEGASVQFVWFAGSGPARRLWPLHHDIRHAGLDGVAHVVGPEVAPLRGLAALDVVVVTRRGVPEPPRMARITQSGVPLVRPARPGEEAVDQAHERVVPPLDDRRMADAVLAILADLEPARESARAARDHHNIETIGPELVRLIADLGSSGPAR